MVAAIGNGTAFAKGRDYSVSLARPRAQTDVDRGPNNPRAHHQARQRLLADALHASSQGHFATANELVEARFRRLARSCRSTLTSSRFGCGPRQQAGTDCLDRAGARAQL